MTFEVTDSLARNCAKRLYDTERTQTTDHIWVQLPTLERSRRVAEALKILEFAVEWLEAKDVPPAENSEAAPSEAQIEVWMRLISAHWDGKYRGAWERKRDLQEEITLVTLDVEACGQAKDAANLLLSHHFPIPF